MQDLDPAPQTADVPEADAWVDDYLSRLVAAGKQSGHGSARTGLRALLRRHPALLPSQRVIRIAGSKGKGSTALLMEALLRAGGQRTGVFTSPHLQRWNERIRIDGRDIASPHLARLLRSLARDVGDLRGAPAAQGPDFFEVMLAAALLAFSEARVDWILLECGIGGSGDATAAVGADLAVITRIEREHADLIGPRLRDIAREKSGIMVPGRPAVAGRLGAVPAAVIDGRARALGLPLYRLGRDFHTRRHGRGATRRLRYKDEQGTLPLSLPESLWWLGDNVATAVAAVRHLPDARLADATIADTLSGLALPGRLELIAGAPPFLVDAAHTRASSKLLAERMAQFGDRRRVLVVALSRGHAADQLAPTLWQQAQHIITTRSDPDRGLPAAHVAAGLSQLCRVPLSVVEAPREALALATDMTPADGLICATGSVYLAGLARSFALARRDTQA